MTTDGLLAPGEDDFGTMFDSLSALKPGEKAPDALTSVTQNVVVAQPVEPVQNADTSIANPDTPTLENPAATGDDGDEATVAAQNAAAEAKAASDAAAVAPQNDQLLERFVKAMEAQKPAPAPVRAAPAAPAPLFSQDEANMLIAAEKDYPDIIKAVQLLMRGASTVQQQQIMGQVREFVQPVAQTLETVQVDHQLNALTTAIPDYLTVRDPAIKWATSDPSIPPPLRKAYMDVIENGDVGEVKWLVGDWRKATGQTTPTPGQTTPAVKPSSELSTAAKQAAAALAPVVSRRTAAVTTAIPTDFDGAWDHFSTPAKA
jgi:hypothetical protein